MRSRVQVLVLIAMLSPLALSAQPQSAQLEAIGRVKNLEGAAWVVRGGERTSIVPGDELFQGDVLETAADSELGLLLGDDTRLSVGADTSFEIKSYLYEPEAGKAGLLTRLAKGTLLYVSGLIAKVAPDAAQVETPVGTLGIRGTRFLVVVEEAP